MNRFLKLCFAGIILFLVSGMVVSSVSSAEEDVKITADGVTYSLTTSGQGSFAKVVAVGETLTEVTIPSEVTSSDEKYIVNSIDSSVFLSNTTLTKITVNAGSSFTMVLGQFASCTSLTEVIFGEGMTEISNNAFYGCTSLEKVTLPSTLTTIGTSSFQNCSKLTTVNWPAGLKSIGTSAFQNCSSLTQLVLGNSIETLSSSAFRNCTGLTTVTLPDSVTSIGVSAFQDCTNLRNLVLGANLSTIESSAFAGTAITQLEIPAKVTSLGISEIRSQAPFPSTLTELTVASGNEIYSCENNILISKTTDKIIYSCAVSGEITVSKDVGPQAFYEQNITKLTIASGVKEIDGSAFASNKSLTEVNLPATIETIGNSAFSGCESLVTLNLANGITTLTGFMDCTKLTSVTLPDSVKTIGDNAFQFCSGLTTINLPADLEVIGQYAFGSCTSLESVSLPSGLKEIGSYAFFGSNVTFSGITLGADTEIKLGCFVINLDGATGTALTLNKVVCDSEYNYGKIFYNASNCTVALGKDFTLWEWKNGLGISLDGTSVYLKDPSSTGDVIIPASVTKIVGKGFQNSYNSEVPWKITCESLTTTITLDSGMGNTSNLAGVFLNSKYLTSVSLPNVNVAEKCTFSGCTSLNSISMTSISSVPANTFNNTDSLTEITLSGYTAFTAPLTSSKTWSLKLLSFPDTLKKAKVTSTGLGISLYDANNKAIKVTSGSEAAKAKLIAGKTFLSSGDKKFYLVSSDNIVIVTENSAGNTYQKVAKGECIGLSGSGQIYRLAEGYVLLTTVVDGVNTYIAVEKGKVYAPADPTIADEKQRFAGWYTDADCTKKYDASVALTADTTVYAKIVTLADNEVLFTTVVDGVKEYKVVTKATYTPGNPVSSNKNLGDFEGWYTDAEFTTKYDASVALTKDTVVYAKFKVVSATVNLVEDGKIVKTYENIAEGKTITLASSETEGFEGWSINGLLLGAQYTVSLADADSDGIINLAAEIVEEVKTTWNLTVTGTGIDGKVFCTASNLIGTYGMITVLPGEFEKFDYVIKSGNAVVGAISDSCLMVSSKDGKDVEITVEFRDVGKAAEYSVSITEIVTDGKSGFRATLTAEDGGYIDTEGTFAISYVYKVYNETEKAWVYTTSGSTEGVSDCEVALDKAVKTEVISGDYTLSVDGAYLVYGYAKYSYKDASAASVTITVTSPVIVSFVSTVQAVIGKS